MAYYPLVMRRVYLDVCCLSRPFDDQNQERVHLESEAVLAVLARAEAGLLELVSGDALTVEIEQNPDIEKRRKVRALLMDARYHVAVKRAQLGRAEELRKEGLRTYDALHVASAEAANVEVLLTTDDRLLKMARRPEVTDVRVCNPLEWIAEDRS